MYSSRVASLAALALLGCATARSDGGAPDEPLVDLAAVDPRIRIEMPYASRDNFTGRVLYDAPRCLLRASVAERLSRVQTRLERRGVGLLVWDGYRPRSVQYLMWELVPDPRYVADPAKGSRHNRGAAVDVTLVDFLGRPLTMPTGHDDFSERAHRDATDGLPPIAIVNRALLSEAMAAEGFTGLSTEWWHFDAPGWEAFALLDVPLSHAARP